MTQDPRALARELLARAGAGTGSSGPAGAMASAARHATTTPPARSTYKPGSTKTRLEDLPQVRQSLDRDTMMATALAPSGSPNPYYRSHTGFNGATITLDGQQLINFSAYNYLGLAGHPRMIAAAKAAIDEYGTTSGATRIVSGNIPLHEQLEAKIASCYGVEDATTVGSGFLTNASVIAFVLGEKDLALCDALVHNSIVSGTQWAHCQRMQFRHNDPEALEGVLSRTRGHFERVLVILEGVYSMDGDIGRLPELIAVARKYDCLVMVDEAHSFAVLGDTGMGVREHFGMAPTDVDIWMGTLSKALASHGGFIAGSHQFIQACRMSAPGMSLYAAGPTPATAAAALTAIEVVLDEPERLRRLKDNGVLFLELAKKAGFDVGPAEGTPIIPVMLGTSRAAMTASVMLGHHGINANPILYPAVPEGEARIRFFLSSEHTKEQMETTIETLSAVTAEG
jgi:8-amino-7-oxononanoate synthase